jgi:uncharacterized membrane protein
MLIKHVSKCFLAGMVAILPIGGTVLTVAYLESTISDSGIAKLPFYFPGLGLLLAVVVVYLLGLLTTTIVGRWAWKRIDEAAGRMPIAGRLYVSLKQILGYGAGEDAVFKAVVMVRSTIDQSEEIGLVTGKLKAEGGLDKLVVFVPGSPNPTSGRLVVVAPENVKPSDLPVHDALRLLVTLGMVDPRTEGVAAG